MQHFITTNFPRNILKKLSSTKNETKTLKQMTIMLTAKKQKQHDNVINLANNEKRMKIGTSQPSKQTKYVELEKSIIYINVTSTVWLKSNYISSIYFLYFSL